MKRRRSDSMRLTVWTCGSCSPWHTHTHLCSHMYTLLLLLYHWSCHKNVLDWGLKVWLNQTLPSSLFYPLHSTHHTHSHNAYLHVSIAHPRTHKRRPRHTYTNIFKWSCRGAAEPPSHLTTSDCCLTVLCSRSHFLSHTNRRTNANPA